MSALGATDCIDHLRSNNGFGYKVQAIAAHVLLRLGYHIEAINHTGHPDILATKNAEEFRFEVEAETTRPRPRKLDGADFEALTGGPNAAGYYALAISFPRPYWIVVPASKLLRRSHRTTNMLLEALSDKEQSAEWTREYVALLEGACHRITMASFENLKNMALAGRRL